MMIVLKKPRLRRKVARRVELGPPEPPVGLYLCGSKRCRYVFVHDVFGWFYIYDYDVSVPGRSPLGWGGVAPHRLGRPAAGQRGLHRAADDTHPRVRREQDAEDRIMTFNNFRGPLGEKRSRIPVVPPEPLEPSLTDQGTNMVGACGICGNAMIPLRIDRTLMWHQATRSIDGQVMDCPGIGSEPV